MIFPYGPLARDEMLEMRLSIIIKHYLQFTYFPLSLFFFSSLLCDDHFHKGSFVGYKYCSLFDIAQQCHLFKPKRYILHFNNYSSHCCINFLYTFLMVVFFVGLYIFHHLYCLLTKVYFLFKILLILLVHLFSLQDSNDCNFVGP